MGKSRLVGYIGESGDAVLEQRDWWRGACGDGQHVRRGVSRWISKARKGLIDGVATGTKYMGMPGTDCVRLRMTIKKGFAVS